MYNAIYIAIQIALSTTPAITINMCSGVRPLPFMLVRVLFYSHAANIHNLSIRGLANTMNGNSNSTEQQRPQYFQQVRQVASHWNVDTHIHILELHMQAHTHIRNGCTNH